MSARAVRKVKADARDLPIDVYLRISLDQENDELGVRRQEKEIVADLKRKHRKLGKIITDNDTSAYTGVARPGFAEVCERIRNGASGGVAAYHWKRLLRRPREMEDFIELIEDTGALVLTVTSGDLDLGTASGRAMARIFGSLGAMEVEEMSERMRARFRQDAESGAVRRRGPRPFGYNDDWTTLHPVESKAYKELFQLVIKGHSLKDIAERWEQQGILDRKQRRFSTANLRHFVDSPRAIGAVRSGGEILEGVVGQWEPITTKEVQDAALAALRSRRPRQLRRSTSDSRAARLLSSLLVCGNCGTPLRLHKSGKSMTYACNADNARGCGNVRIDAEHAEREVEKRFLARLIDPKTHRALEKLRRRAPDTSELSDEVERLHLELEEIKADHDAGEINYGEWKHLSKAVKTRLEDASARLNKAGEQPSLLAMAPERLVKLWPTMDLDERRRRLAPWVNEIKVVPVERGKRVLSPHGTVQRYWSGCKCAKCLKANNAYHAARKSGEHESHLNGSGSGRRFDPDRIKCLWRV